MVGAVQNTVYSHFNLLINDLLADYLVNLVMVCFYFLPIFCLKRGPLLTSKMIWYKLIGIIKRIDKVSYTTTSLLSYGGITYFIN